MQVRFLFELLDVVAVGPGVSLPVDLPQFIAERILPMLGEFAAAPFGG